MSATTAAFSPAPPTQAPEFPRHVVTAVLVSHDGARWLPDVLAGLLGQDRPVQNVVAADTGSADDSAHLVAAAVGDERVLHLARRTGFGAAVEEAARTAPALGPDELPYLRRPSGWDPVSRTWNDDAYDLPELPHGEPVQWLWLLHDDAAPDPDALSELLRVADADAHAAVIGPKLRGWYDRKQLLEVGVSIANSGRRWTGLDRREQDQGQHDQVRPVLSVSSAGMLIRRDVYEQLGGFDRRLPLMRDDVDLCWRAHAAGHRVLIAPDAVLRHAEASARERRTVDCVGRSTAGPHRVDKAGAVYTLLANTRGAALPWTLLRILVGTVLRTLAYLLGKAPGQALDEITGLTATLLRPGRILAARKARARGVTDPRELRPLFPPPGATVRATVEQVTANFGASDADTGSRHGAVESGPGGDDADFLEVEQFARLKKIARKPGPVLFVLLLLVALAACRALFGPGALAGGALLPAPEATGDLWSRYADAWHPLGSGGTQPGPPYLALLAGLSALLLGSPGAAVTALLVASVPLAGVTAYLASRPLVGSKLLRAWGAVAYAFLPAATGALATGRLGTAILAVLLPLIARAAVAAYGLRHGGAGDAPRGSWRATWAYAFLLTLTTAFTPVVWPLALVLGLAALALRRTDLPAYGLRFLAALGTPILLLAPWSLTLLTDPARLLTEAGAETAAGAATATDLLGASPGGPGAVGGLLLIGLVLAALAALLRADRRFAVLAAWTAALAALLLAALVNASAESWAGPATLVYGLALIAAGMLGAEGGRTRVGAQSFGWRQPVAVLIALAAAAGPLVSAATWAVAGADGPLERRDPVQVPAFVAEESATSSDQPRTLVLAATSPAEVSYTLLRGSGARLGDAELTAAGDGDPRLDKVVAHLVGGSGADQTAQLSGFGIRYVLVRDGAPRQVSRVLDTTPGLSRLSQEDGSALWRLDRQVARAVIVPPAAEGREAATDLVPVPSGPVEAHTDLPAGPAGRTLRIADRADDGWEATLDGRPLKKTVADGWAQAFELPAGGGRLDLTYQAPFTHTAWVWAQCFLVLVLFVLALPGRRRTVDDDLPDEEQPAVTAEDLAGDGRRARRLRAAAAAAEPAPGEAPAGLPDAPAAAPLPDASPAAAPLPDASPAADPYQPVPDSGYGQVPQQPAHAQWDDAPEHAPQHQDPYAAQPGYEAYPGYPQADPYQQPYPQAQYPQQGQPYEQWPQYDQSQPQQYDPSQPYGQAQPYEQPQAQPYEQPYDGYDPQAPGYGPGYGHGHAYDEEQQQQRRDAQRPDGSSDQ
ncbi:glycosyltransferase family 2 protein [Streptomyces sp. ODS05-4]|uniref:glycosyltransferase family 2 protein n=1 Tax=Streptomyces sp. ODS05-4 TaxID=2944939 RepID=UPI00210D8CBB|nr:glycosyltransferase [Streptomyces sp. ODS05-4]